MYSVCLLLSFGIVVTMSNVETWIPSYQSLLLCDVIARQVRTSVYYGRAIFLVFD